MEKYKVFFLVILAIIPLNLYGSISARENKNFIILNKADYEIIDEATESITLKVKSKRIIKKIKKEKCLSFMFTIRERTIIAKDMMVMAAAMPTHCNYYYLSSQNGKVLFQQKGRTIIVSFFSIPLDYQMLDFAQ